VLEGEVKRIFFTRLLEGEDLTLAIRKRVEEKHVKAGFFMVIGSLRRVVLGYYSDGEYTYKTLNGPLEIASCTGNIAVKDGSTLIHSHIVVSNGKMETFGGHLAEGSIVGATAELVVFEVSGVLLKRFFDEKTRLNLIDLG
jgi:predicted DNA-binding protein with PD1-like motif